MRFSSGFLLRVLLGLENFCKGFWLFLGYKGKREVNCVVF